MGVPTSAHLIYIPFVLIIGVVLGFILGGRAARDAEAGRLAHEKAKTDRRAKKNAEKPETD